MVFRTLVAPVVTVVPVGGDGHGLFFGPGVEVHKIIALVESQIGCVFDDLHVAVREGLVQEVLGEVGVAEVERVGDTDEAGVLRLDPQLQRTAA